MSQTVLQLLCMFLAGLVLTSTLIWAFAENEELAAPGEASIGRGAEDGPRAALAVISREDPASEEPAIVRASRLMEAALPVIRACSPAERAARWELLLQQLQREGNAGHAVIMAFLETGEDLPIGPRIDLPGIRKYETSTLRLEALRPYSFRQDPETRQRYAREMRRSLEFVTSIEDAYHAARALEYVQPRAHRDAAISALKRIGTTDEPRAMAYLTQAVTHYGAAELLPVLEQQARKDPAKHLGDFIGALWKVPVQSREEFMERAIATLPLREQNEDIVGRLDFRIPVAREHALAWLELGQTSLQRARFIEKLGSEKGWAPRHTYPTDDWRPDPSLGTPGTPAQAAARLSLIGEIERYFPESYLQEKLNAARAALEAQAGPAVKRQPE